MKTLLLLVALHAQEPLDVISPLPEAARALEKIASVSVTTVPAAELEAWLRSHQVTLALGYEPSRLRKLFADVRVLWHDPFGLVCAEGSRADAPKDFDALLFDPRWHDAFLVPRASAVPELRMGWLASQMREPEDEPRAFAWLRTVDAHAKAYCDSETDLIEQIARGVAPFGVASLTAYLRHGRGSGLAFVLPGAAMPSRQLALGAATKDLGERFATPQVLLAIAKVCELVPDPETRVDASGLPELTRSSMAKLAKPVGECDVETFLAKWRESGEGFGRRAVAIELVLDCVFAIVFAAFLFYAWRRLAKADLEAQQDAS